MAVIPKKRPSIFGGETEINPSVADFDVFGPLAAVSVSPKLAKVLREYVLDKLAKDLRVPDKIKNIFAKVKNIGLSGGVEHFEDDLIAGEYAPLGRPVIEDLAKKIGRAPKLEDLRSLTPWAEEAIKANRKRLSEILASTNDPDVAIDALGKSRGYPYGIRVNTKAYEIGDSYPETTVYHELTHLGQDLAEPGIYLKNIKRFGVPEHYSFYDINPLEIGANVGAARRVFGNNPSKILGTALFDSPHTADPERLLIPKDTLPQFRENLRYVPMRASVRKYLEDSINNLLR